MDAVHDGQTGLDNALSGIYDLLLLDIMLPEMDGITLLRTIRAEGIATLTIMLTAKGEISDTIAGLDCGADDYVAKPFSRRRAFGPNPCGSAAKRRGRA